MSTVPLILVGRTNIAKTGYLLWNFVSIHTKPKGKRKSRCSPPVPNEYRSSILHPEDELGGAARVFSLPHFTFKGSLVDPRLRTSNDIYAPSKLACYLFRDGG